MTQPHISYVPLEEMDERMQDEMRALRGEGTPRPESSAVRAHVPGGVLGLRRLVEGACSTAACVDHAIKDLCRVYISRTVKCEFCGNQRSEKAHRRACRRRSTTSCSTSSRSDLYDERQKAALAYAEAIAWGGQDLDGLWERLHAHFTEPELVELGCCHRA